MESGNSVGVSKSDHRNYLASEWWQKRRRAYLEIFNECAKCSLPRWLASIAYDCDLNVHHLNYQRLGREEDSDLEALCKRCHELEHFKKTTLRAPWSTPCDVCGSPVYDRHNFSMYDAFLCFTCRSIEHIAFYDRRLEMQFVNSEPVWLFLLTRIIASIDPDVLRESLENGITKKAKMELEETF